MSRITRCPRCGGNIVEPAYPGDGAYPVSPMCRCGSDYEAELNREADQWERDRRGSWNDQNDEET